MNRLRDEAHRLIELGYTLCPVRYGGKTPLVEWSELDSSHDAVDDWFKQFSRMNIAIQTGRSGVIGLDADSLEAAIWIRDNCPETPMAAKTPRGGLHAYFKAVDESPPRVDVLGIGLDVRAGRSILIASPSWSFKHQRRWEWKGCVVPPNELPELPSSLLPRKPEIIRPRMPVGTPRASGGIRDVVRWIMQVKSIQGQNGSGKCFKVACKLVDSGMDLDRAWQTFLFWNSECADPPWSEKELMHKLASALKRFG